MSGSDGFETLCLKGNHELAMLQFLGDAQFGRIWKYYGGLETFHSYGITANLTARNSLNVTTNLTNLNVNSPSGSVNGTFTNYTGVGGPIIVNGKTQTGSNPSNPNQIVVEGFTLPAGTFINSDGQINLPSGMLVGLVSPAAGPGAKGGKQKVVIVHSVQMLGQLLAEGYVAIIIDLSKNNDEIEEVAMN